MRILLITILMMLGSAAIVKANELEDVAKDLTKYYLKDTVEHFVDFDNPYIKYGAGTLNVIVKKEIEFNITENTEIEISQNSIFLQYKKEF